MEPSNPSNTITNSNARTRIQETMQGIRVIRKFVVEFCDNSNIHGLRYISERKLHWSERLLWLISIAVAVWLCGTLTRNIWTKWINNPMTIEIAEKQVSISSLPFPTVTICPAIKFPQYTSDVVTSLKSAKNLSNIEIQRLSALAQICPSFRDSMEFHDKFVDDSIYETIQDIGIEFNDTRSFCAFVLEDDCADDVHPVLTDNGLCVTFNALNSKDLYTDQMAPGMMILNGNPDAKQFNIDRNLTQIYNHESYPRHTIDYGNYACLSSLYTIITPNNPFYCERLDEGLKIMLTMPGETLSTLRHIYRVPPAQTARISITPKLFSTAEDLYRYAPDQRQCYFDSERQLRFFRIYTQSNCKEECLANFTAIECGCVQFFMPRDENTAICGAAKIDCYESAAQKLHSDLKAISFRERCNCLSTCNFIEYIGNVERIEFEEETKRNPGNRNKDAYTFINICYGTNIAQIEERLSLYTYSDFLADCGSLLGLFMGISALSIVELIYYLTLRLFLTIRPIENRILENKIELLKRKFAKFKIFQWNNELPTKIFTDFSDNSNIHGLLYFTRRGLHWVERLWWIITFGLSVWLCSALIGNVWVQWQENPVKMSYDKVPISSIPFPTITICPEAKTSRRKIDFKDLFNKSIPVIKLEAVAHSLPDLLTEYSKELNVDKYSPIVSELIYETIQEIALELDEVVKECRWLGQLVNCSEYLSPILTEDGVCFTFNALNSREIYTEAMSAGMKTVYSNPSATHWNIESGYEKDSIASKYPRPLTGSLELTILKYEIDKDPKLLFTVSDGFKVAVTTPGENLKLFRHFLKVFSGQVAQITLNPKLTTSSEGLRKYDPNRRGCFFQTERQLRFFKMYTKRNCEIECLANFTKNDCGCVKFSMPREENIPICGIGKYYCYHNILSKETWDIAVRETVKYESFRTNWNPNECNCLPACTNIEYNAEIDAVRFRNMPVNLFGSTKNSNIESKYAKISILSENQQIESINQLELYTISDFLAICGGVLGLAMGASALSFIEIIYFFTLRVFWSRWRERQGDRVLPFTAD